MIFFMCSSSEIFETLSIVNKISNTMGIKPGTLNTRLPAKSLIFKEHNTYIFVICLYTYAYSYYISPLSLFGKKYNNENNEGKRK